jgi:hypothetical protein
MDKWRDSLHGGVSFEHPTHQCKYYGGIDDLWVDDNQTYYVVDYKATAKSEAVTEMPLWADGYKRQAEICQWLIRKNGLTVSDTAYFVYCTGDVNQSAFNQQILFQTHVISYVGSDIWIDDVLNDLQECLNAPTPPNYNSDCVYCKFAQSNYFNII